MSEGIVLRKVDYKETSYIVTIITEEGFDTLFINGAKKKNSNKLAISEILTEINYVKSNGKYQRLTEGIVTNDYKNIKSDLFKLSIANVMLEYVLTLKDTTIDHFKLYNLLKSSLEELEIETYDLELSLFRFELILLSYIGLSPKKEYILENYNVSNNLIESLESIMKGNKIINEIELREFFNKYFEREGGIVLKSKKLYYELLR
ncbi:DNA repair protein RecO [bacterium]|nr:DNA repair protein RecO [bacterium]